MRNSFKCFLIVFILLISSVKIFAQSETIVSGIVYDAETEEPIPLASVILLNSTSGEGVTTDNNGYYKLKITSKNTILQFICLGYETEERTIKLGEKQTVTVKLNPTSIMLDQVVVKKSKYNKKNAAVDMIKKAIALKSENRIEAFDYYQYQMHEKAELGFAAPKDSTHRPKALKKVDFIFDNTVTSLLSGRRFIPFYFTETLSDKYYRKNPQSAKTYINARQNIEISKYLESESVEVLLRKMFGEIDIYDNNVMFLSNSFMSPLSPAAPNFYKFYITDTVEVQGYPCYELFFAPMNSLDIGFMGKLFLLADSTYAVKRIEFNLTPNNQINFVTNLFIEQEFEKYEDTWVLETNSTTMEFSLFSNDNNAPLYGRKTTSYKNFEFNVPQPDNIYSGLAEIVTGKDYEQKTREYWDTARLIPLTHSEEKIYSMYEQLENVWMYRFVRDATMAISGGYVEAGMFDIGPLENMLSFNSIENVRMRIGGKTNGKFNQHLFLEGFVAYGTRDQKFKYNTTAMYSFNKKKNHPWEFPMNLLTATYEHNTRIPGQGHLYGTGDRLFLSIGRGKTEKMTFDNKLEITYQKETSNNFSYTLKFNHLEETPLGLLNYKTYAGYEYNPYVSTTFGVDLRLAPNETYVQSQKNRYPINNTAPIYKLKYTMGIDGVWKNEYTFHKLEASFNKRWFISSYGYLDFYAHAGKIWNQVPYPSLFIHHANQDLAFQEEAYNMMRFLEFVSDEFAEVQFSYNFNGFLLNRVPLIKKLKWRELVTFKALYGSVDNRNVPSADNPNLMLFPHDENGNLTTFGLGKQPYMEAGIGIENIFKFLRVDFVKRLNYLDNPDAREWSVRVQFKFSF